MVYLEDVLLDNVGGELLDTVLDRIRTGARVSICGAISQYDDLKDVRGPKLYLRLAERNARMGVYGRPLHGSVSRSGGGHHELDE